MLLAMLDRIDAFKKAITEQFRKLFWDYSTVKVQMLVFYLP